jgi:hypothetical protein
MKMHHYPPSSRLTVVAGGVDLIGTDAVALPDLLVVKTAPQGLLSTSHHRREVLEKSRENH